MSGKQEQPGLLSVRQSVPGWGLGNVNRNVARWRRRNRCNGCRFHRDKGINPAQEYNGNDCRNRVVDSAALLQEQPYLVSGHDTSLDVGQFQRMLMQHLFFGHFPGPHCLIEALQVDAVQVPDDDG